MAVWKAALLTLIACLTSFAINKWEYAKKWGILKLIPLLPAFYALTKKLRPGSIIDRAFVTAGHCFYHSVIALSISKWIPLEYGILLVYAPLPLVFERKSFGLKDIASHNDIFYKYYIQLFWSLPIISSMKLLSNIYKIIPNISISTYIDHGIHAPMISIINDDICVGRLPLNNYEVDIIRNEPYNICAVINMCLETTGPIQQYTKYGIKYIQYPTVDTLPPKLNDIVSAMQFIEDFVVTKDDAICETKMENNRRILIHCRGGRSRSATIALCWLLKSNINIQEAMKLLSSKRAAIHPKIQYYDVVYEFCRSLNNTLINLPSTPPTIHRRLLSFHLMD